MAQLDAGLKRDGCIHVGALVGETGLGRRDLRFPHRLGEVARPRDAAGVAPIVRAPASREWRGVAWRDFDVTGNMANLPFERRDPAWARRFRGPAISGAAPH